MTPRYTNKRYNGMNIAYRIPNGRLYWQKTVYAVRGIGENENGEPFAPIATFASTALAEEFMLDVWGVESRKSFEVVEEYVIMTYTEGLPEGVTDSEDSPTLSE